MRQPLLSASPHPRSLLPAVALACALAAACLPRLAAAGAPCGRATPVHTQCEIALSALRPTQSAIGLIQVEERVKRMQDRPDLVAATARRALPVVQAPDGSFYLTDGHHQASVLLRLGVTQVRAELIGRLDDRAHFWQEMQARRWVYLYGRHGETITPTQLPQRIADLADDPYRSLAGYAEDAGYIARTSVYYMEFDWARYFGARMHWQPVDRLNLLTALQTAERLACAPEASSLPGYAGPCRDSRRQPQRQ